MLGYWNVRFLVLSGFTEDLANFGVFCDDIGFFVQVVLRPTISDGKSRKVMEDRAFINICSLYTGFRVVCIFRVY